MSTAVQYLSNRASEIEISEHLFRCDTNFMPPLSGRVEIKDYVHKILSKASRFEAWSNGTLVGLVAIYCNDQETRVAYITSVSVLKQWTGKGIAAHLMSLCIKDMKALGMTQVCLEVLSSNTPAIRLYKKSGFISGNTKELFMSMNLNLRNEKEHEQ